MKSLPRRRTAAALKQSLPLVGSRPNSLAERSIVSSSANVPNTFEKFPLGRDVPRVLEAAQPPESRARGQFPDERRRRREVPECLGQKGLAVGPAAFRRLPVAAPLVPRGGEVFVQGGAQVDECAVFFVECAEFGLKGREEPSLKRLPEDVYGLKGFVECLSRSFHMDIITYCGATFM